MFRSELDGCIENQGIYLKIFPPQVTAGESAVAQLEPVGPSRTRARQGESPWNLVCDDAQLGISPSYSTGIPIRFDQPGRKHLLATSRVGPDRNVLARADLVVHGRVDDEIGVIVRSLDEFGARSWFQSVLERHRDDDAYEERLDLILCQYLTDPVDSVRKTAFGLLVQMHKRALRRTAARYLGRDEHGIDDVIQEASRRAWRSLRLFEAGRRFGPWIHTALLNACRDVKRGARITTGGVDPETSCRDEAIAAVDARETLDHLTRGFDRGAVEMFTLRYGQGESYINIARSLNIQPDRPDQTRVSTVRRQVERLKMDLKTAQGSRGDTGDTGGIA